jgi:ribosomal protein L16/L10AE
MFEVGGVDEATASEALLRAAYKMPVRTKIVKRIDPISGQEVTAI